LLPPTQDLGRCKKDAFKKGVAPVGVADQAFAITFAKSVDADTGWSLDAGVPSRGAPLCRPDEPSPDTVLFRGDADLRRRRGPPAVARPRCAEAPRERNHTAADPQ
jgi:hypothetical protein